MLNIVKTIKSEHYEKNNLLYRTSYSRYHWM